jgi:hypothetical protein
MGTSEETKANIVKIQTLLTADHIIRLATEQRSEIDSRLGDGKRCILIVFSSSNAVMDWLNGEHSSTLECHGFTYEEAARKLSAAGPATTRAIEASRSIPDSYVLCIASELPVDTEQKNMYALVVHGISALRIPR